MSSKRRSSPALRVALMALTATAATLLVSSSALAYNTYYPSECNGGARWPSGYMPSAWWLNQSGYSPFGTVSAVEASLTGAWSVWSTPCCTDWAADYQGTTANTALTDSPQNVISFATQSWPPTMGDVNGTLAVTMPGIYQDCTIRDSDMLFNGVGFVFVDGAPQQFNQADIVSIAVHEMGHWLGLDHSNVQASSLWWSYSGGTGERSLHQDDIDAVCFLYDQACACTTNADCAAGEACQNGACVVPPCTSDAQCASPLVCNTASGQCVAPPCATDADCGAGFMCQSGICSADTSCTVCDSCTQNADCGAGGICAAFEGQAGGVCTIACSSGGTCPGDAACYQVDDGAGNVYQLCLNPGAETDGLCPASYTCMGGGGSSGSCNGLGNDCANNGAMCTSDNDVCLTEDGASYFCSCFCTDDADCGAGNSCVTLSDGSSACVPGGGGDPCGGACTNGQVCDTASGTCVSDAGCTGLGNDCANNGALCTSDNDICVGDGSGAAICSCTCTSDADCGSGNVCAALDGGGSACVPGELLDPCAGVTCPAGQACNPQSGVCESTTPPEDTSPGDTSAPPTDTSIETDTSVPADTTPDEDTATPPDTATSEDTATPPADAAADDGSDTLPGGLATGGEGDGDCACASVRASSPRDDTPSPTPWTLALLGLVGLVGLRRRR